MMSAYGQNALQCLILIQNVFFDHFGRSRILIYYFREEHLLAFGSKL